MALILYDLSDVRDRAVSPYAWRIRESLLLLERPFETRLLGLTDIRQYFSGAHQTIPVLVDGTTSVGGSWTIAEHLATDHDPESKLFGNENGYRLAAFVTDWVDAVVLSQINRMIVLDVHDAHREQDRDYFRKRQEEHLGASLEQLHGERERHRPAFQLSLHPARRAIKRQLFLGGPTPTYADFALHATFQWARLISDFPLLRTDDRIHHWLERMDAWLVEAQSE